jgi:tripartite-type tricarboxylate transporter receptor subunit TctC
MTMQFHLGLGLGLCRKAGAAAVLSLGGLSLSAPAVEAQDGAEFFKGKTVTYVVATGAGGGYDFYGRLVAEYMQRHIPGSTFVVKNMPGAGHMIGANYIYAARPDGLTVGTFNTGLIYNQLVQLDGVKFDLGQYSWIGKAATESRVVMVDAKSTYKTLADMRASKTPLNWSASGVGSAAYVETRFLIDLIGIPGKIIYGYSGNDELLAIRRGEIQAVIGSPSSYDNFLSSGYGRLAFQIGGKSAEGVPQLRDLVANDGPDVKAVVALIESQVEIQRFTAGPPKIPADRLTVLRAAFRKAMEDPELQAIALKGGKPVEPAYGDDVAKMISGALDQPPSVVKLLTTLLKEPKKE